LGSAATLVLNACQVSGARLGQLAGSPSGSPTPEPTYVGDEENLKYNNPFQQQIDPAWYDGKKVYHFALNWSTEQPPFNVAEQYLFVYEDEYQAPTTVDGFKAQPKVPGQFVVFDSVPGQPNYSPIWHNNWVLVPRSYEVNSIRSVDDIKRSFYQVVDSPIYVN
jgi:hypothetical protein